MKKNLLKKSISSMFFALTIFNTATCCAYKDSYKTSYIQKAKNFIKNNALKISIPLAFATTSAIGMAIGARIGFGGKTSKTNTLNKTSENNVIKTSSKIDSTKIDSTKISNSETQKQDLINFVSSKYTTRQEGVSWCWAACLEGLFRYHNINYINQEKIVSKLFNVENGIPTNFWARSGFGLPLDTRCMCILAATLNNFNENLVAKVGIFPLNGINRQYFNLPNIEHSIDNIKTLKEALLDYYNSIDKNPFMIVDADAMTINDACHAVNVISIEDNQLTIEEPTFGISYKRNIDIFLGELLLTINCVKFCHLYTLSLVPSSNKVQIGRASCREGVCAVV